MMDKVAVSENSNKVDLYVLSMFEIKIITSINFRKITKLVTSLNIITS